MDMFEYFKAIRNGRISAFPVNEAEVRFNRLHKECSKVADHVYLGGRIGAANRDMLRNNGITHVLNCLGAGCPEYFKDDGLIYKTLWLTDRDPEEDIISVFYDVFDYIEDVREHGGRVLVHCRYGQSASAALVIAYFMWREKQSYRDAFNYVYGKRMIVCLTVCYTVDLWDYEKRIMSHGSSVLRMYRIAPHSCYDPYHLVPKDLADPSPSGLDSRGAFIIVVPSPCGRIYVWIGKKCEPIMETDAKGSAAQVVHYEYVQGPIIVIKEGEEPLEFWDAFSGCGVGVQVGSEIGERKIESYHKDFELFQDAIMGKDVELPSKWRTKQEISRAATDSNWSGFRRLSNSSSSSLVLCDEKAKKHRTA